jgi:hypothetical protein
MPRYRFARLASVKKLRALWKSFVGDVDRRVRMGRFLGLLFIAAGFVIIGFAWNGAAGKNFIQGQFPYLLSGGVSGLGLIITGSVLLLIATARAERQILTDKFDEMALLLSRTLGRMQVSANGSEGGGEQVIAGSTVYHRAGCKILDGKKDLTTLSVEQAVSEGLSPCRACDPPTAPDKTEVLSSVGEKPSP